PALSSLSALPALANNVMLTTTIGNQTVSYVDNGDGAFVSEPFQILGISNAASAVATLASSTSGVVTGDSVFIENVFGMTQINGGPYTVTAATGATITINVNSSDF